MHQPLSFLGVGDRHTENTPIFLAVPFGGGGDFSFPCFLKFYLITSQSLTLKGEKVTIDELVHFYLLSRRTFNSYFSISLDC